MFYYTLKDNKIEQYAEIKDGETVPSYMQDWLKTEDKIITLHDNIIGSFVFEKDADMVKERQIIAEQERVSAIYKQIAEYEKNLADTDYIGVKIAEGVATKEEYAEQLANRAEWRSKINELRALL